MLNLNPLRKVRNKKNATKTQRHKISQNNIYQLYTFGGILSFSALVARKRLFGMDSILGFKQIV